ncbi:protein kinase domain-containing protein [Neorhodopirellula pilleata]|uniref:Serine/threonine-protein kinase StkP n=1 Tax=Neorhodopirellula pilleata TaxID=2714738 RepID=A0A5C6ARM7_9BACT|nr:protein kinase [Neorhodopirellula pilleata]TWU01909.1 Serine/threonine-protein kinase StkP [Neorhodopirellula pilleata]
MSADQTINVEFLPVRLKPLTTGTDGESLLEHHPNGTCVEVRVLSSASIERIAEVESQLNRLELLNHPSIRPVVEHDCAGTPASFKLAVPIGLDPLADRLSVHLDDLTSIERYVIAVTVIDACAAAHRIGLCHGNFSDKNILVARADRNPQVFIDFTATEFNEDVIAGECSIENDLVHLHTLLRRLLLSIVESSDAEAANLIGGRSRAILRRWIKDSDAATDDANAPTLRQWKSILKPVQDEQPSMDQTGVVIIPPMPIGSGGTSRMHVGGSANHSSVETVCHQLGRFRIDDKIGEGGMGTVFRATDLASGETVAVKVLRSTGKDIAQSVRRFRKEARLLADVQNDHVTKLIEVGEDSGHHFLAMEFIEGVDLKAWLAQRSAIPEQVALQITADLARALVDAHAREVIHRDIKPENVLLKLRNDIAFGDEPLAEHPIEDFSLKLTDFGIARHVHQSESMEMTVAGSVIGTPKYMSPEQCKSTGAIGPATDVYSIGITLFQMLAGSVPFESDDFMKLAAMHCFDPVPSIQKRNATVSDATARIVQRALAKNPNDRFGDAGQLLTEILQVLRGEASQMEAHPKLPASHLDGRVWEKTVTWDLDSTPAQLWPLVSNTERLNEAIGLPSVDYQTVKDPELGLRKFGSFTLGGVKVAWEEHPFEWIEGQRMGILREFETGPFKWFMSIVTMQERPDGGTVLSHQVRIEPRNLLGRVLTKIEADWKGFRHLDRVYRRMDRSVQGRLPRDQGIDAYRTIPPLAKPNATRLQQRLDKVIAAGVSPDVASILESVLRHSSAQELAQLRPIALADRFGIESREFIDACLIAAGEGILNLRWEVLCPTCRVSALSVDQLATVNSHTHCEACDVDFQSNLAGSIEMVFQAHPEIREVNTGQYCIGGPEHSPHVLAQVRIEPGECLNLSLDLSSGDYLIRGPRLPQTQSIRVQSTAAPSLLDISLSTLGHGTHTPKLRAGRQTFTIENDFDQLHVVRVERMIPRDDVITAAMASANPLFGKLFPHQKFASDNPIATETMTFMATCINNVDDLYAVMGDAEAYTAILEHHQFLNRTIESCGGKVVKTIGESLLACFLSRDNAVIATQRIRVALSDSNTPITEKDTHLGIQLGIGIHSGPTLVTTQNNQLDYFGGTVRAAMSLPELAGGDTLITEVVYTDPSVAERLQNETSTIESVALPGCPNLRVKRI